MTDETKQAISEKIDETVEVAEETVRLPIVKSLTRFGFYTKGCLYIIIGFLAILLVSGLQGGKIADPTGALGTVAQKPFGKFLLIVFIVGAIGHGLWNVLRGAADVDNVGKNWLGIAKRILFIGIGLFYVGLALTAWSILLSANASDANGELTKTITSILLAIPLGVIIVFIIGLGLFGASAHECYSGFSGKFREYYRSWEIKGWHGTFISILGVLSFTARAVIFAMMGYFFILAAINYNANKVVGLEGALSTLAQTSYGGILLFLTAIGLVCHGILAFYEAKYRRIC
ncbi:DUF1206 domain-containing protein [soil metagenome]